MTTAAARKRERGRVLQMEGQFLIAQLPVCHGKVEDIAILCEL